MGLECTETSTSLLHVLLLQGGSKMILGFLSSRWKVALNLISEWNGDGPLLWSFTVINLSKVEFESIYRL